tara:strand:+ start:316 stop:846 length:531 start_codon:yes stop_codon:yes gene_type:complete
MLRKILALLILTVVVSCSTNPVSVEKLSTFNLSDYSTFQVKVFAEEDTKVSPFTKSGLKREFTKQLSALGLSTDGSSPGFTVKISIDVGDGYKSSRSRFRRATPYYRSGYAYDPFFDDYYHHQEQSYLRVTLYSTSNEEPLWTGLRPIKYVDTELKLSETEIAKYVESLINEIVNS